MVVCFLTISEQQLIINHRPLSVENCPVPSNASGYAAVDYIRTLAEPYGSVRSLKAYLEVTEQTPSKTLLMRSELQSSGVSLVDCPYNGRKDVADKMIIGKSWRACAV